ncbi:9102_t:CDS:2, partial [Diversispora eburnea]
ITTKFVIMADMSNDEKIFAGSSSPCPSITQDTIIKMWVLFEGEPSSDELTADITKVPNLAQFKRILKNEFDILKDVRPSSIVFFNYDDRSTPIPPGTLLQPLADSTTDTKPLVVRYPISDSSIVVNLRFLRNTCECEIPYSSGAWDLLQKEVKDVFKNIASYLENANIIYSINNNSTGKGKLIKNEFLLMKLLKETKPNESNERCLDLKIEIEGKKAFGDWKFKEVIREIYNNEYTNVDAMPKFLLENLPELSSPIEEEEIECFITNLKNKAFAFHNCIHTNEATVREYISIFMTTAVNHIRKSKDSTTKLKVESELNGTRGYGNVDYEVNIQNVPILINEVKKQDMEKGVAQNLVQVYTAGEKLLRKRKRDESVDLFGIVTMGDVWRFIHLCGTLQNPMAEITEEIRCNCFGDDYQEAKKVVSYIAQLLQAQANMLKNDNDHEERDNKRIRKIGSD